MHATNRTTTAAAITVALLALAPSAAQAGGTGDFYKHYSCSVNSAGTANLDITNYDIATGQRYHMDVDSPDGYRAQALYVDDVKQPSWNDVYKDFSNPYGAHTIKAVWYKGLLGTYVSCYRKF